MVRLTKSLNKVTTVKNLLYSIIILNYYNIVFSQFLREICYKNASEMFVYSILFIKLVNSLFWFLEFFSLDCFICLFVCFFTLKYHLFCLQEGALY